MNFESSKTRITGLIAVLALSASAASQTTWYVDAGATGNDSGSNWQNAFTDLQSALDEDLGSGDEIWVAAGTYRPSAGFCVDCGTPGPRHATFLLPSDVGIYGGFLGNAHSTGGESQRHERDPENNETILSGDLGTPGDPNDNAYHVVTAHESSVTTVLSGFTVTGGNADGGSLEDVAGGILVLGTSNAASSPQVSRCRIIGNRSRSGAAVYVLWSDEDGDPVRFVNCTFLGNTTTAGDAGGLGLQGGASPGVRFLVANCVFSG